MKILIPQKVDFKISTTNIDLSYKERSATKIVVEGLTLDNFLEKKEYALIELNFETVAELRCVSMNFFEVEYDNYKIEKSNYENTYNFWKENNYCPDPGFYSIRNSTWLEILRKLYDPRNVFNLQHYLITGYDSYIELLASSYKANIKQS